MDYTDETAGTKPMIY